jgi:hypothetical protein
MLREIKVIPIRICEHNPKAQSICYPDTEVDYNQFQENLYKQLKQYDTKRNIENREGIRIHKTSSTD